MKKKFKCQKCGRQISEKVCPYCKSRNTEEYLSMNYSSYNISEESSSNDFSGNGGDFGGGGSSGDW